MKWINYLLMCLFSFVICSCEHKELCYDHNSGVKTRVVFDWKNAPDANPETMSLYLFSKNENRTLRYDFVNRNGGVVEIPQGDYRVLGFNSDTESILFRGIDIWDNFEIYTPEISLLKSMGLSASRAPKVSERVAKEPDMVWSDRSENISIVASTLEQVITLYPKSSVITTTVEIKNVKNLKHVSMLSASISSMSGGLLLGKNVPTDEKVTIPFNVNSDGISTITGKVLNFGHCHSEVSSHKLVVYVILDDGSKWFYTYDVTKQMHDATDPTHIHIVLDGLPLPEPIVNGGGLHPAVDEWQDVNIPIKM